MLVAVGDNRLDGGKEQVGCNQSLTGRMGRFPWLIERIELIDRLTGCERRGSKSGEAGWSRRPSDPQER